MIMPISIVNSNIKLGLVSGRMRMNDSKSNSGKDNISITVFQLKY